MKITVTAQDIATGFLTDPYLCPIIRAIRRDAGYPRARLSTADLVWFNDVPVWLPPEETSRLQLWERTGVMIPHEFELTVSG